MEQKQDDTASREKCKDHVYDRWLRRVERSKKVRKEWEIRFRVADCEKYFLGEQWGMGERKELIFNHFLATVKTIQPSLFVSNPSFWCALSLDIRQSQPIAWRRKAKVYSLRLLRRISI